MRPARAQDFWSGDKAALFRFHECGGDAGAVECFKHFRLGRGPLVGVALAGGHQPSDRRASHISGRLHKHLDVKAVGKAPLNLAHCVTGESEHGFCLRNRNGSHWFCPQAALILCLIRHTLACDPHHLHLPIGRGSSVPNDGVSVYGIFAGKRTELGAKGQRLNARGDGRHAGKRKGWVRALWRCDSYHCGFFHESVMSKVRTQQ